MISIVAVLSLFAGFAFLDSADEVDAETYSASYTLKVGQSYSDFVVVNGGQYGSFSSFTGDTPPGCNLSNKYVNNEYCKVLNGTPTTVGIYHYTLYWKPAASSTTMHHTDVTFTIQPATYTVIYNAGIGVVNGSSTWSENIIQNSFASLPSASYSSGAYQFKGWSTSSGSSTVVSSYTVTSNVTLYAVWEQQTTTISSYSATVTQGQSFSNTFTTNPSNCTISITSYGGLTGQVSVSGKTLSGTITSPPSDYFVVLSASSTGYKSGTVTVKITVPIVIVPPIEYTIPVGMPWSYEPVTNPSYASISITGVLKDGSTITNSGVHMVDRTISNTSFTTPGTYSVTFSANAVGYVGVSKTVLISVYTPPVTSDPPSINTLQITQRAGESRTFDLVAIGVSNAANVEFYVGTTLVSTSSMTAVFEVPSAGFYTGKVVVIGFDGSRVEKTENFVCIETYHKEMAWATVEYVHIEKISGSDPSVSISGSVFTHEFNTLGTDRYLVIRGTPNVSDIGSEFTVMIGSESFVIKVYAKEEFAPVPDFEFEIINDSTVRVTFTGQYASKVLWDYGGGVWVESTEHSYTNLDEYYTLRCLAINNVSERMMSKLVEIGIVQKTTIDIDNLTDYYGEVGETVVFMMDLINGESITISGSAADVLSVDGNRIFGVFDNAGEYELIVTIHRTNGTTSQGTMMLYIVDSGGDDDDSSGSMIILLAIILSAVFAALVIGTPRKKSVDKKSGGKRK